MKKITLFAIGALGMLGFTASAQTARVQVVHNCADAAAATVDVYLNGALLLNDFAFRTATPFIDAPSGVPLSIDIAPGNSSSVAQSIYNLTTTLSDAQTYVLVADGIVSATGYNPAPAFGITVFSQGREAAGSPANTDVLVHHGATDAPAVDVVEMSIPAGTVVNDLAYPGFTSDYLGLITGDYIIDVTDASRNNVVASYAAPLESLGLQGAALMVVASGFLDPAQNSNGPAFGLWVALPSGGALIPLPPAPTARVQVIHNCADLAAAIVDVYANGALLLDDFAFRTATPFVNIPAGVPVNLSVAPGNSASSAESIYDTDVTLLAGEKYVLVANGIVSAVGYVPAPPFELSVFAQARETATTAGNTDVLVVHGSTDAPTVDVLESSVPAGTLVDDISFPSFSTSYLELPTADYVLDIADASGTTILARYAAPLATLGLQGQALAVVASGFLNPMQNSNGAAFGLWVALPSGGPLVPLPDAPLGLSTFADAGWSVYPNPANDFVYVNLHEVSQVPYLIADMNGRTVASGSFTSKIDVTGLAAGVYILSLPRQRLTHKLVVN